MDRARCAQSVHLAAKEKVEKVRVADGHKAAKPLFPACLCGPFLSLQTMHYGQIQGQTHFLVCQAGMILGRALLLQNAVFMS